MITPKSLTLAVLVLAAGAIGFLWRDAYRYPAQLKLQPADVAITSPDATEPVRMLLTGDIMLGRSVQTQWESRGTDFTFARIRPDFVGQDLIMGNLEGPILENAPHTPTGSTRFSFPSAAVGMLKSAGFSAVSLANNHSFDYGKAGYEETGQLLDRAGIGHFGHPLKIDTDQSAYQVRVRDNTVRLLAVNATFPSFSLAQATTTVAEMKSLMPTAYVVVLIHWGEEYQLQANQIQQNIAHALINAGADTVVGHHPHVVENIEVYRGRPIFYSLGNFIFDQYFATETQRGLLLKTEIYPMRAAYELVPVKINRSQPQVMGASTSSWQAASTSSQPASGSGGQAGQATSARTEFLEALAARSAPELHDQIISGRLELARFPR
ncbi:MAG: CapA family protein [Candidatus Liptonbacteria bacterium]|nr:CapA family protein [Candidatus Liptonbacteria bacterium]